MGLLAVATAGREGGPAALAACAARRWLARNAAGVKLVRSCTVADASACVSLVSCLPALETAILHLPQPLAPADLRCLLEALAGCPRLKELKLHTNEREGDRDVDQSEWPSPNMSALAQLRSLTKLTLAFGKEELYTLAHAVDALASLTGLAELDFRSGKPVAVPATLRQLAGLRSLSLRKSCRLSLESLGSPCVLEAGCFDLPNLQSLEIAGCNLEHEEVLPGVTALQSLTRIEFRSGRGPRFFDQQLVQLPRLQSIVYLYNPLPCCGGDCLWLSRLPADTGSLSSTLRHLTFAGYRLTQFPLALCHLVALDYLDADRNDFAVLPAAITALSRLAVMVLGRRPEHPTWPSHPHPLDVRALGDLSGFGTVQAAVWGLRGDAVRVGAGRRAARTPCAHCLSPLTPRAQVRADGAAALPGTGSAGARQRAEV